MRNALRHLHDDPDLPASPTPLFNYAQLTPRERRFVDGYVLHLDRFKAAKDAGYRRATAADDLLREPRIRAAVRERTEVVSELAGITAADLRRELKVINDADVTELSGVHRVPCRHCHGMNSQYQYTDPELYYVEQACSYGEQGWPFSCVTNEFGPELHSHARAAWISGKEGRSINLKGGGGYSRNNEVNQDCPQCHGQGVPMAYVCDTRHVSEGGRKILKGLRIGSDRIELLTIDRNHVRDILARDLRVGVERKELVVSLPKTAEEFRAVLESMPVRELEQFVSMMVTLGEGEYAEVHQTAPTMRRGN